MKRFALLISAVAVAATAFGKDPFANKEDAVGYIVVDSGGEVRKFIVIESKEGKVKLIKTEYEPDKVLKGGKRK